MIMMHGGYHFQTPLSLQPSMKPYTIYTLTVCEQWLIGAGCKEASQRQQHLKPSSWQGYSCKCLFPVKRVDRTRENCILKRNQDSHPLFGGSWCRNKRGSTSRKVNSDLRRSNQGLRQGWCSTLLGHSQERSANPTPEELTSPFWIGC